MAFLLTKKRISNLDFTANSYTHSSEFRGFIPMITDAVTISINGLNFEYSAGDSERPIILEKPATTITVNDCPSSGLFGILQTSPIPACA